MRAYIEGVAAMREMDPGVRILTTEPLVNMVPPVNATPEQAQFAAEAHVNQFQATDILSGRMCPELGGQPEFLDLVGLNFYYNNQWIVGSGAFLPWVNEPFDPRWRPLHELLAEAYQRYQRPLVITETSHPQEDRPHWMRFVADECAAALRQHVPLWGVCLYPIIDRPDWDHLTPWYRSGLWDATPEGIVLQPGETPGRVLCLPYAEALLEAQTTLAEAQVRPLAV
jgi:hypothetical protein